MAVTSAQLLETLKRLELLDPMQLVEANSQIQGNRFEEGWGLARYMVQRGWLTLFQANILLAGGGSELVFGPYHVLDLLGQGGLSTVYKARHSRLDFLAALKVLRSEVFVNEEGRQQFLLEVESMAQLDHPNVVQFCDVDQSGDTFYFAMEFIEGIDLGKSVRSGGPLSVRDACDFIHQAALGLQHAHEHNIVHRDIKPVNLFLTEAPRKSRTFLPREEKAGVGSRGLIKILDWGLASLRLPKGMVAEKVAGNHTRVIVGTADYLPPEQAMDANTVDIRGDIYSLGCTFYFLLTGQAPFPDGSLMQKILNHQRNEPTPVDQFRNDVPAPVLAILKRMVAKNPKDRYQTPAAAALALLPFIKSEAGSRGSSAFLPIVKANPTGAGRDETPLPAVLKPGSGLSGILQPAPAPATKSR